jgi:hypothetical protein
MKTKKTERCSQFLAVGFRSQTIRFHRALECLQPDVKTSNSDDCCESLWQFLANRVIIKKVLL